MAKSCHTPAPSDPETVAPALLNAWAAETVPSVACEVPVPAANVTRPVGTAPFAEVSLIVEVKLVFGSEVTGAVRLSAVLERTTGKEMVATAEWLMLFRLSPLYVAVTEVVPAGTGNGIFTGIANGPSGRV